MEHEPCTESGRRPRLGVGAAFAGSAAVVAGLCWIGKGGAILATGIQPALLFEVAPLLMAVAVLGLAAVLPPSRTRAVSLVVAAIAAVASVSVVADFAAPLPVAVTSSGMAVAHLLVLATLVITGIRIRRGADRRLPLMLGIATAPAILLGGLLAAVLGERWLELPLVALGVAWVALGTDLLRQRFRLT